MKIPPPPSIIDDICACAIKQSFSLLVVQTFRATTRIENCKYKNDICINIEKRRLMPIKVSFVFEYTCF